MQQWSRNGVLKRSKRLNMAGQGSLTLRETRVLQLAILNALHDGNEQQHNSVVQIHASQYAHYFGADAGYVGLSQVADTLGHRELCFYDDPDVKHKWCDSVTYQAGLGTLEITLSKVVTDELPYDTSKGDDDFTSYRIENSAVLNSVYAVRMYETLNQWRHLKATPWISIQMLRHLFSIPRDQYIRMCDLKRLVIDKSVNMINGLTTMDVTYTQKKSGRVITHIQFQFHRTNRRGKPPTPASLKAKYLAAK